MMRSMMSAVSGLRAQQTAMDVIGNNIANVNTAGYKASNINFSDLFYQTIQQGNASVNPSQVGYGAQVSSVDKNMSSVGGTETDNPLDLYVDGEGFFAVNTKLDGTGTTYFTRLGNFHIDASGHLVDSNGNFLLSAVNNNGTITPGAPIDLMGTTLHTTTGEIIKVDQSVYSELSNIQINANGTVSASIGDQVGVLSDDTSTNELTMQTSGTGDVNTNGDLDTPSAAVKDAGGADINLMGMYVLDASGGGFAVNSNNIGNITGVTFNSDNTVTVSYKDTDGAAHTGKLEKVASTKELYGGTPAAGTGSVDATGALLDSASAAVQSGGTAINVIGMSIEGPDGIVKIDSTNVGKITSATFNADNTVSITYKDASGNSHTGTLEQATATDEKTATVTSGTGTVNSLGAVSVPGTPIKDQQGHSINIMGMSVLSPDGDGFTVNENNIGNVTGVTFNADNSVTVTYKDASGINHTGTLVNIKENDQTIALATFVNPNGLNEVGNSYYTADISSGNPSYVIAGNGNSTNIRSGELEMSNVDLAKEFTNMIVTQRGFQANSRVITVSDSMLEELVDLKRQ